MLRLNTMDITFYCGSCGQRITIDEARSGGDLKCPSCGNIERIPAKPTETPSGQPKLRLRGAGANAPPLARGKPCPACGQPLATEDAIICMKCGCNLETGKQLDTKTETRSSRKWVVVALILLGIAAGAAVWFRLWS